MSMNNFDNTSTDSTVSNNSNLTTTSTDSVVVINKTSDVDLSVDEKAKAQVAFLIDVSGSMSGGRIEAVKTAFPDLVKLVPGQNPMVVHIFHDFREEVKGSRGLVKDFDMSTIKSLVTRNCTAFGQSVIEMLTDDSLWPSNDPDLIKIMYIFTDGENTLWNTSRCLKADEEKRAKQKELLCGKQAIFQKLPLYQDLLWQDVSETLQKYLGEKMKIILLPFAVGDNYIQTLHNKGFSGNHCVIDDQYAAVNTDFDVLHDANLGMASLGSVSASALSTMSSGKVYIPSKMNLTSSESNSKVNISSTNLNLNSNSNPHPLNTSAYHNTNNYDDMGDIGSLATSAIGSLATSAIGSLATSNS